MFLLISQLVLGHSRNAHQSQHHPQLSCLVTLRNILESLTRRSMSSRLGPTLSCDGKDYPWKARVDVRPVGRTLSTFEFVGARFEVRLPVGSDDLKCSLS